MQDNVVRFHDDNGSLFSDCASVRLGMWPLDNGSLLLTAIVTMVIDSTKKTTIAVSQHPIRSHLRLTIAPFLNGPLRSVHAAPANAFCYVSQGTEPEEGRVPASQL